MSGKAIVPLIEYEMADDAVRTVYDDIMQTRKVDWINNFWKVLAHDPALLKRTWETLQRRHGARCARSADQGDDLYRGVGDQWLRVLHLFAHRRGAFEGS